MTISVYQNGDLVRLAGVFRDVNGTLIDPSTVSLKVTKPSGSQNTYTLSGGQVVKDSTGNYHYDVSAVEAGEWYYTWTSTGTGQAAENGQFTVEAVQ